ncbi:MAG: class II poly(R)-hydroxyalkanoic acid synthase [Pseudomonas sp.]|uniref:class II poly(R)-hydroxyalkanoic acid synthase n=1 Tax=Pseudomonas sp. TaxID=306 RepID=UPI003397DD6A
MPTTLASGSSPAPATFVHPNGTVSLRGRDFLSTLRMLGRHSVRRPLHSAKHALALGGQLGRILLGDTSQDEATADARFADPTWKLNPFYRRSLLAYKAWQKELNAWIDDSDLYADDRERARFIAALVSDALAPSNHPLNPLALKELLNSGGASVLNGLRHFVGDLRHNGGMPAQVDKQAFEVGGNIATTPGSVVYRNELLELIHYQPQGEKQYSRPLLIVPPQINKYYVFDLSPEKSFVQHMLKNDLPVFMISWRNPDARHSDWSLSTYVQAIDETIDVCLAINNCKDLNLVGVCSAGLTIGVLQGYLQSKRQLRKINSASYFVSLLDSQLDTPIALFADEKTLDFVKRRTRKHGVLEGSDMAKVFAWLRPNDLIWNYWVNNYLLGKEPPAFDVLYWNNDSTRLPAAFHADLLDFFKHNPLRRPGALRVCDSPIDLRKVTVDSFTVAGTNDHITPWEAVYRSTLLLGGKRQFVLSNSGHIQAILNPPGNPKANYFTHDEFPTDPKRWFTQAQHVKGSWWTLWTSWLQERSGELRDAVTQLGSEQYPPMEPAPGLYVHEG